MAKLFWINIYTGIVRCAAVFLFGLSLCLASQGQGKTIALEPKKGQCAAELFYDALADLTASNEEYTGDCVIELRAGVYRFSETLVLDHYSMKGLTGRLTIRAAEGAEPILVGSYSPHDWRLTPKDNLAGDQVGNIWETELPCSVLPKVVFDKHGMLSRSRSDGFTPTDSGTRTAFSFPPEILTADDNLDSIELSVRPSYLWAHNILPLKKINRAEGTAETKLPATYDIRPMKTWAGEVEISAWLENCLQWVNQPGRWAASASNNTVYLWSRNGKRPQGIEIPLLTEIIRIEGDEMLQKPVRGLTIKGLTFSYSDRETIGLRDRGLQHDWDFMDKANAMLRLRWAENITVEDCKFTNSGASGMRADLYAKNITVRNNTFSSLGGGGILFCGYGPGVLDLNHSNTIADNKIEECARLIWHMPGIHLWQSGGNRVVRNVIENLPYSGIIISGIDPHYFESEQNLGRELSRTIRWAEVGDGPYSIKSIQPYIHTRNNLIAYNQIRRVMQTLGDGNGIYIRFASETGNRIVGNLIEEIEQRYSAGGIRCDGRQSGVEISSNLIRNVQYAGISSNGVNTISNNFIVDVLNDGNSSGIEAPYSMGGIVLWNDFVHGSIISDNVVYDSGSSCAEFVQLTHAPWLGANMPDLKFVEITNNIHWQEGDMDCSRKIVERLNRSQGRAVNFSTNVQPIITDGNRIFFDEEALDEYGIQHFEWSKLERGSNL